MSARPTRHRVRLRLIAATLLLGGTLAGCTPAGPTPTAEPASPPPLTTSAPADCLADVAGYPDATMDPVRSADVQRTVLALGGSDRDWSHLWTPTTADVHLSADFPDKVLAYVAGTMKALGWTHTRHRPGRNWGFDRWSKGRLDAQVLVGMDDGRTVIVRGCRTSPTPSATPIPATTG